MTSQRWNWQNSRGRRAAIGLLVMLGILAGTAQVSHIQIAQAADDVGYRDFSWSATSVNGPTGEKPQSKLWFHDGSWWGSLFNIAADAYTIHRFDWASQTWINTGTIIDNRNGSWADCLWDGTHLYIASAGRISTNAAESARLMRYSYDAGAKRYTLDTGFPVTITSGGMEAIVLDKDSLGKLWITYTQNNQVYVNRTQGSDSAWGTPFVPPVKGTSVKADDLSAVIAFRGNIGIMWSNQIDDAMYFAIHRDSDPDTVWQATRTAIQGPKEADDHINLKSLQADSTGQIFAAIKTSLGDVANPDANAPLIRLLVMKEDSSWTNVTFGRVSDDHTRPIVMIDEQNRQLYMFATSSLSGRIDAGTATTAIFYKQTSLDAISFVAGKGTPFIQTSVDTQINNVTSTKQNLSGATGLLVLASDNTSKYYLHNVINLSPSPPTATATSTAIATITSYRTTVLADNPVSTWRLDETSGTIIADSTGSNSGALYGGVTLGVPGALATDSNPAMAFDGSTGYASIPNSASLNPTGDLTVEAWAKPTALDGMTHAVVHKGSSTTSSSWQYRLTLHATNQWRGCVYAGSAGACVLAPGTASTTSWTHLVLTRSGTTVTLYIDGASVGTATLSGALNSTTGTLGIGRVGSNATNYFKGGLDEVALYAGALSAERIAAHYAAAIAAPSATATPTQTASPTPTATATASPVVSVASVDVTGTRFKNKKSLAVAKIKIVKSDGQPAAGATVTGVWSGAYSSTVSATTDSSGIATFTTPSRSTSPNATYTFTTKQVSVSGMTWDGINRSASTVVP